LVAVCGFGVTRLLLPAALRRYELLWIAPVGACVSGLGLTALGFAHVPLAGSIAILFMGGLAAALFSIRRAGPPGTPPRWRELGWPAYVAVLLACVALIPLFRAGFPSVSGNGSDAHLAVGAAQFLEHNYPTGVNYAEPIDRFPIVWRSKFPIYYNLAAVAMITDRPTYEAISTVAALMLALAAVGWFLFARDVLRTRMLGAVGAMGIVGLDPMVLHTGMHPYFNQTWGYFTLPFALVLGWSAVHDRSRGGLVLLVLFLALGAFAYPLALPIPVAAVIMFAALDRDLRAGAGGLWRRIASRRRSLALAAPVALLLLVPLYGVAEKLSSGGLVVLDPSRSLGTWGGDLVGFFPEYQFLSLDSGDIWPLLAVLMVGFTYSALRDRPRELRFGILAVLALGALAALDFRLRTYGYYFHFKVLAFTAPLLVVCAAAGVAKLRWRGVPWLVLGVFALSALGGAYGETRNTYDQTSQTLLELRKWSHEIPPGASVRLDVTAASQLWTQYMLSDHRTCAQLPLFGTDYPRVVYSRKADYALVSVASKFSTEPPLNPPYGAVGPPVLRNTDFALYRLSPSLPGPDTCSQRLVETVTSVPLS
jgi:hypothetical protein